MKRLGALALLAFLHCHAEAHQVEVPPTLPPLPPITEGRTVIPNTAVDDTPENREVIAFCERYRKALEAKDVEALVSMVSRNYREGEDTYATLREFLSTRFRSVKTVRFEMRYLDVSFKEAKVHVDYDFAASYEIEGGWRRTGDKARLVLERNGSSFLILSGM